MRKLAIVTIFLVVFLTQYAIRNTQYAYAGVVLKASATNPSEIEEHEVTVKLYLPRGIKPENVIEKGELEIAYDVKQGQYYAYRDVKLKPKTSVNYEIEIEDIWLIDSNKLNTLKSHAETLASKLERTEYAAVSRKLKEMVEQNIETIFKKQDEFRIPRASPIEHISAYEANMELLETVREDVGTLENLVIGIGGDPGTIMGESSIGAKTVEEVISQTANAPSVLTATSTSGKGTAAEKVSPGAGGKNGRQETKGGGRAGGDAEGLVIFKTVVLKVEVENPSPSETQIIPVKYYLPKEIKADDVIDSGELELGFDFEKEMYYLFKDEVALEPGEKKAFDVIVKDKWSISEADLLSLKIHAENMVAALEGLREFNSAQQLGKEVVNKIDKLLERKEMPELTDEHIAAFREDTKKLDEVKKDIQRMENILMQAGVMPEITIVDERKLRQAASELGVSEARLKQVQKMKEARKKRGAGTGAGVGAEGLKLLAGTIFRGKAPSTATTWKIIFAIIGFLAAVSFIFFLVWSAQVQKGKRVEKIGEEGKK